MAYILFNSEMIFGIYETLDLIKFNSYVFVYDLLKSNKIPRDIYFDIKKCLMEEEVKDLVDLQKIMIKANIHTEYYQLENNGSIAFKNILRHISERFKMLQERLEMDKRVTVRFPGNNAADNMMLPSEIKDSWKKLDGKNYKILIQELENYISLEIQKLELRFGDRIQFGNVSDKDASETSYQVWPADIGNWDLPVNSKMFGDGFAVCFEFQVPGVFGIVTNPMYGYKF